MYVIIYDFGTSSVKTCLFEIKSDIELAASSTAGYGLYISDDGGGLSLRAFVIICAGYWNVK